MTRVGVHIAALIGVMAGVLGVASPIHADPPIELPFEVLPATDVDLIDAGGYKRPYRMRGVEGRAVLPSCAGPAGCAPYTLISEGPLALEAQVPRIPLRVARKGGVPGQFGIEAGIVIRHAAHDGAGHCRAQLGLGADDPYPRPPEDDALTYHVEVPCKVIEVAAAQPPQKYAAPPTGFRRYTLTGTTATRTLIGPRGARIVLDTLRVGSPCDQPRVYAKNTARKLEVMMVGAGQWVRGAVPPEENASYSSVHILPGCIGPNRNVRTYARGPDDGRAVVIASGAMLRARDFEAAVVKVSRPVRARVVKRERSFEIVRWTAGVDYLCRRDVDEGPCVPGLFVREADLEDERPPTE